MQRNARYEARQTGKVTYNTGKLCRNGHLSDRYTLNGACISCLKNLPPDKSLLRNFVTIKVRLPKIKATSFGDIVYGYAKLRVVDTFRYQVELIRRPTRGDGISALYQFKCDPLDKAELENCAREMFNAFLKDLGKPPVGPIIPDEHVKPLPAFKEELPYLD